MTKLRVVEVYGSYQGEGPNTSKPTVFVRFAGCNFKCPLWPCDTQHAIDPKLFKTTQRMLTPEELAKEVMAIGIYNICLTGGEVFLQNADALSEFVQRLGAGGNKIECFTNGGLEWRAGIAKHIDTFIFDWKLPGSGESYDDQGTLQENMAKLRKNDAIKFTIADHMDYEVAVDRYHRSIEPLVYGLRPQVYAGVVWGKLATETLCQWMLADGINWNLNVQVHKFVWHPDMIGV